SRLIPGKTRTADFIPAPCSACGRPREIGDVSMGYVAKLAAVNSSADVSGTEARILWMAPAFRIGKIVQPQRNRAAREGATPFSRSSSSYLPAERIEHTVLNGSGDRAGDRLRRASSERDGQARGIRRLQACDVGGGGGRRADALRVER